MKRLGIFSFTDKTGIVDEYVLYLLNDISPNLDELCIICNNELTKESHDKLQKITDLNILFKPGNKFDVNAWRDVMVEHYGFEMLQEFDEIVLFNNSFFGPIYPFKHVFDQMENKNLDFWGITRQGRMPNRNRVCPYSFCPRFIQHYFLVIRKRLIQSHEFQRYWTEMDSFKNSHDVRYKHEVPFTKHFRDLGFIWNTYVDTRNLEDFDPEKNLDLYVYDSYNLVKNRNLPVFDMNSFKEPRDKQMEYHMALNLSNLIDYVKTNTSYDVSLVYDYLTRVLDPNRIVESLNLVRIFSKDRPIELETSKKVLVIVHLYYEDLIEYDLEYLKNIPEFIDILITCNTSDKKSFFENVIANQLPNNVKAIKVGERGRDLAALLIGARDIVKDYDYFCFIHDKKSNAKEFVTVGSAFREMLWENTLASANYIRSIVKEFEDNPRLGLVVPPRVHHGTYFNGYVNDYWIVNYDNTVELLETMGIETPIEKDCAPISLGNCFWARYDALKPIFELYLSHSDFPEEPLPGDGTISHALERVHGYVAASRGYYSEFVMTEEYARGEMLNYNHMASETFKILNSKAPSKINFRGFSKFKNTLGNITKK